MSPEGVCAANQNRFEKSAVSLSRTLMQTRERSKLLYPLSTLLGGSSIWNGRSLVKFPFPELWATGNEAVVIGGESLSR